MAGERKGVCARGGRHQMKFLANMCISTKTVQWLRQQGYDATHLREEGLHKLPDEQVLAKAVAEQRIVLTMDLDFGYFLAISKASLPSVILFRLEDKRSERVNERLSEVLRLCLNDLSAGAIVVVTETTIRVRRLPI